MGATRNTGYIENLIAYDGNNNIGVGGPVNVLYKVTIGGNTLISGNLNVTGTITFSSNVTANSFVKNGGVATEFLKADGTVDSSTYATVSYVDTSISNLIDAAPAALNTLNELAAALGDDSSFSTTVTTALGNRLRIDTDAQGLTSEQKANGRTNLGVVIGTDVQAYDADLGAIAALTGTSGLLKKTAANTWTLDTNTYITGGFIGTTALQSSSATQAMTGISSIEFVGHVNDVAKIEVTTNAAITYFDFTLADDNNQEEWRWRFNPTGGTIYSAMRLVPTTNTTSNLIVSGTIAASNFSGSSSGTNTGDQDLSGYQPLLTNPVTGTGTTNRIAYWNSVNSIAALDTASYPTLTELSYVKGVTSAIQTQINAITANYVTTNTTQEITVVKTFKSDDAAGLHFKNAAGTFVGALSTYKQWFSGGTSTDLALGAKANLYLFSNDGSNWAVKIDTNRDAIFASKVKIDGGTSSQFLKANGDLDTNTYLTGNQTITLTGDVTGSGTTSIATTVNAYFDQRVYTRADNYLGGYYVSGGTEKPNNTIFGGGKLKVAMLAGSNLGYGGPWNDVLWISTYTGGDVKSSHALVFDKYSTDVWVSDQNFDSASWGTGYRLLHSGNYDSYALPLSGGTMTGDITLSGSGRGIYFTGGNNRIYFAGNRAIEGNGTNLQIGEGHSQTQIQSATLKIDGMIQLPGAGTNNRSEISVGSVPSWGVTGKTFMTDGVANYGVNNNGIILQCGYNDGGDVGGIKITDDGVIIWGAGDEDLFRIYNEDTNVLALVINDSNNMTLNGGLTVNSNTFVTGTLTTQGMITGNLTGNVTGNLTGNVTGTAITSNRVVGYQRGSFTVGGNTSTFYPVAFQIGSSATGEQGISVLQIERGGYDEPGYSNYAFSTFHCRIRAKADGWGYGASYWRIEANAYTQPMLADVAQQNQTSQLIVWLRGGCAYRWIDIEGGWSLNFSNPSGTSYSTFNGNAVYNATTTNNIGATFHYQPQWGQVYYGGTITAGGDVVAYSDARVKSNLRPIENVLERLCKSRGILYDRTDVESKNNIGFVAQELEETFPELVTTEGDKKSVKYQNMVAVLTEAIKEQQKQIEELKSQIKNK